jgi:hypothetical protein
MRGFPVLKGSQFAAICALIAVWILIIGIVNPCGNFMVNDDWAYHRAFEIFMNEARVPETGWGPPNAPGGPALIAQLIWAAPFSRVWGTSPTVLRMAVLTLAVLGSLVMLGLLVSLEAPPLIALFTVLTIIFNPLFLSQSFTFMTDIPLVSFMILSLFLLFVGVRRSSVGVIIAGLFLSLCATLTRQVGLVIPIAFVAASIVTPAGRAIGRLRLVFLAFGVCAVPWIAYELYLLVSESTPITQNQLVQGIYYDVFAKGLTGALALMSGHGAVALLYTGFSVSPLILLIYDPLSSSKGFRNLLWISFAAFALVELSVLLGLFNPLPVFSPNIIYNFGIGPLLLKDTYILGMVRNWVMPPSLYCAVFFGAVVSTLLTVRRIVVYLRSLGQTSAATNQDARDFFGVVLIVAGLICFAVYLLTGFHDRYLIPLVVLVVLLVSVSLDPRTIAVFSRKRIIVAVVLLGLIGSFSVLALHDFMSMKRALHEAHKYITVDLRENPCNVDGGFEFNGYNCYRRSFVPQKGLSWWWVNREDYMVTLGPLDGYGTVRVFPFKRLIGINGAVCILKPIGPK